MFSEVSLGLRILGYGTAPGAGILVAISLLLIAVTVLRKVAIGLRHLVHFKDNNNAGDDGEYPD
jgi:hypothetical protein